MKRLTPLVFTLTSFTAFAGSAFDFYVTKIECSGSPRAVHFELEALDTAGNYNGAGIENFLSFDLTCSTSASRDKISCTSPQGISATIVIDSDRIVTADFRGKYRPLRKVGCIARN